MTASTSPARRLLPAGLTRTALALRLVLFLLPCGALAMALPAVPHPLVVVLVILCAGWWARTPDHLAGAFALALVAGWWAAHGVLDWRVPVVAALVLAAHVVATVLSYGPESLAVDPHLAALWARRGLLALVPMPVTWVALRGLDADQAPPWLWLAAAGGVVALMLLTARLTQQDDREAVSHVPSGFSPGM